MSALEVLAAVGGMIGIGALAVFGSRARTRQRRAMVRAGLEYGRASRARRGYRRQDWDFPQQEYDEPPGAPGSPPDPASGLPHRWLPPCRLTRLPVTGPRDSRRPRSSGAAGQSRYWWQQNENPPEPPPGWQR